MTRNTPGCEPALSRTKRAGGRFCVAVVAGVTFAVLPVSPRHLAASAQNGLSTYDEVCVVRDRDASAGIALALLGSAAGTEARIDNALLQLRRARTYCRRSWTSPARVEYDALRKAFPVTDEQVSALLDAERSIVALSASPRR